MHLHFDEEVRESTTGQASPKCTCGWRTWKSFRLGQTLRQRHLTTLHPPQSRLLCPYITIRGTQRLQVLILFTSAHTRHSYVHTPHAQLQKAVCRYGVVGVDIKCVLTLLRKWQQKVEASLVSDEIFIYTISQGNAWDISSFKGHRISRISSATMKSISFEIRIGKNLLHRAESKRLVLMWSRSQSSHHRCWSPSERNSHSLARQIHDCLWTVLPQLGPHQLSGHPISIPWCMRSTSRSFLQFRIVEKIRRRRRRRVSSNEPFLLGYQVEEARDRGGLCCSHRIVAWEVFTRWWRWGIRTHLLPQRLSGEAEFVTSHHNNMTGECAAQGCWFVWTYKKNELVKAGFFVKRIQKNHEKRESNHFIGA